jgi:hypothetical protein
MIHEVKKPMKYQDDAIKTHLSSGTPLGGIHELGNIMP